jgi:uncharacterized protein
MIIKNPYHDKSIKIFKPQTMKTNTSLSIKVKVKPNSKEESIKKINEGEYEISLKEPAEDNKANVRLTNILAKEFRIDYRKIKIKNPKSRKKIIVIDNL